MRLKKRIRIKEVKEIETFRFGQILKSTGVVIIPYTLEGKREPDIEMAFNEVVPKEEIKSALEEQGYKIIEEEEET